MTSATGLQTGRQVLECVPAGLPIKNEPSPLPVGVGPAEVDRYCCVSSVFNWLDDGGYPPDTPAEDSIPSTARPAFHVKRWFSTQG